MTLCSDGHDEVCYETNDCPCCELARNAQEAKDDLDIADNKIDELTAKIEELEEELRTALEQE